MIESFRTEVVLHWIAVALYGVSAGVYTSAVVFGRERRRVAGAWLAAAALVPHGVALLLRWRAVGHGPYMLKYEVLSSQAWVAVAVLLLLVALRPAWSFVAVVVLPIAILMIGLAIFSNPEARVLPPSLRSIWLVFHVIFAKLAVGAFLVSVAASVVQLVRERPSPPRWIARVPSREALDALNLRFVGFGFVFWTVTIAAGAVWADQAWGRYWGWDPIETWSLVSWLLYGTFLHAKLFFRLSPRATAWSSLGAFVGFVLALIILPFLMPSAHSAYFQ